jgi:ketol-acid reductoisomerase
MMQLYHDEDANLEILKDRRIAVLGYGNQGRSQALNLRDSGLEVIVGNREDAYAERARGEAFPVDSIAQATGAADIVVLLIPDEVAPDLFEQDIAPQLSEAKTLVFASGYNVAFGFITPPPLIDVILVAPRMIGAGVRDLYLAGQGFPSFIGVAQDHSGMARDIALALAKGIGSTRAGVVEVTFAQETELDLFTEQCFGPAFGQVLTTSVDLLLEAGYPPEAVLLELYMSGEFSYTLAKIAELGMIEQTRLHSTTSQYGSMSRGMRFILPELREKMQDGLEEIRSGRFAQEWAAEQATGSPTLKMLREAARSLPLYRLERELRQALHGAPPSPAVLAPGEPDARDEDLPPVPAAEPTAKQQAARPGTVAPSDEGLVRRGLSSLFRWGARQGRTPKAGPAAGPLSEAQLEQVLRAFLDDLPTDPALQSFSQGRRLTVNYVLTDVGLEFHMGFADGTVIAGIGAPSSPAEVRLETTSDVLDGMLSGRLNAMRAAMTGQLSFSGEARLALGVQQIQDDLKRLYSQAREIVSSRPDTWSDR